MSPSRKNFPLAKFSKLRRRMKREKFPNGISWKSHFCCTAFGSATGDRLDHWPCDERLRKVMHNAPSRIVLKHSPCVDYWSHKRFCQLDWFVYERASFDDCCCLFSPEKSCDCSSRRRRTPCAIVVLRCSLTSHERRRLVDVDFPQHCSSRDMLNACMTRAV